MKVILKMLIDKKQKNSSKDNNSCILQRKKI